MLSSSDQIIFNIVQHCLFLWWILPKLVKGGKHVYGWSEVNSKGKIVVPETVLADYYLRPPDKYSVIW
jgi:hypothetical protein